MKQSKTVLIYILIILTFPIFGQSFKVGGRNNSGGLFTVATPGKAGRVVTVGGRLSPVLKINHTVPVSGYIETLLVKVGDRVKEGQPLIKITRNVAGETFLPVFIESRISGIVSEINVLKKQEVNSGTSAITILDNSSFLLVTSLSDRDSQSIRYLGNMPVVGVNTEEKYFNGRILYVSQEPDYNTGLFTLNIQFPYQKGLFLGMVLFVDIEVQKSEGISVPNSAIFKENGKNYLWKLGKDNKLILSEIVVDKVTTTTVIIQSGLSIGERYINNISGNEKEDMDPKDLIKANLENNTSRVKTDA